MGDMSVILEGVESSASRAALYSTIHGAGRVHEPHASGRTPRSGAPGGFSSQARWIWAAAQQSVRERGVVLRGGGPDEAPQVYRRLDSVLSAHAGTMRVLHRFQPRVVVMAGINEFDPYKD